MREPGEGGDEDVNEEEVVEKFFKDRVNDGADLSLEQAIGLNGPKWNRDDSLSQAEGLMKDLMTQGSAMKAGRSPKKKARSPTSVVTAGILEHVPTNKELKSKIVNLAIDKEEWVAKVTPDRIYYVTTHPSESKLLCCAGDKQGYVGLWDVDAPSTDDSGVSNNHGVSLFRPHGRPISCLEWLNNDSLISASYDGSVRRLNVEKGVFEEIFATYDDSDSTYLEDLGYGLDQGYRYWTQFATVDSRSLGMSNPCLFLSTSVGDVFHVDLRSSRKGMITFHESVSEKKVNSIRYVAAIIEVDERQLFFPLASKHILLSLLSTAYIPVELPWRPRVTTELFDCLTFASSAITAQDSSPRPPSLSANKLLDYLLAVPIFHPVERAS